MRISDWSSDVCSSDLVFQLNARRGRRYGAFALPTVVAHLDDAGKILARSAELLGDAGVELHGMASHRRVAVDAPRGFQRKPHILQRQGRKSAGSGKTVPARVELGG